MKKTFIFTLLFGITIAVSAQKTVIKGACAETGKTVQLYRVVDGNTAEEQKTTVDKQGSFTFSLTAPVSGFYLIGQQSRALFPLFLTGNAEDINIKSLGNSLLLGDKNSAENKLLYTWENAARPWRKETVFYRYIKPQDLMPFPALAEKLQELAEKSAEIVPSSPLKNTDFGKLLQTKINSDLAYFAVMATDAPRKQKPRQADALPAALYKPIVTKNPFDNDAVLRLPAGSDMLSKYVRFYRAYGEKGKSGIQLFGTDYLKGELLLTDAAKVITTHKQYTDFARAYGALMTSEAQKKRLKALGERLSFSKEGLTAPDFSAPDTAGVVRKLSDYKGKVVVVDLWATWCVPCRKEMPLMQKLEEEFHGQDVVFIAVCIGVGPEKETWLNTVKSKQLKGVHLFAEGWKSDIVLDYNVKGVPRFMVFDRKGGIVSIDAPRPSMPELKKMIEEELKK